MNERIAELEHAIAALEANRVALGDAVVDTALTPLRAQLAGLRPQQDEQRLRQLSILFLDIAGSTALSQRLDPEDINAVLDGALARFSAIVARHGGRVLQYAGDSMLAVFGLGEAREQAPQLAVQTGLALLAEGQRVGAEVSAQFGLADFAVRVGIHSGAVLLGGGVDGENSIRGLSVNIAARMEQTAPLGGLRISRDTWRLVRGLFEMAEQAPISIKGCAEPVVSYLVQAARAGSQARRGVEGLQTPLVGRAEEFAQLQAAILALLSGQQTDLQRLLVIGDAGLGKSRLLAELRRWLAEQPPAGLLVQAEASESRRQQPYALLAQLLQQQFGLSADTRGPKAQAAWLAAIAPQLDSEAAAAVLGQLLGYDFRAHPALGFGEDARQLRASAFHYASQLLRRSPGPRLWLLDDAHWLDAGSQDFLDHLHGQHADLAMLIVALARPSLFEQAADWAAAGPRHALLALRQLDAAASDTLADALLARLGEIPPELHRMVCEGAEGNPFFMEERVNMLIDQGALLCEASGWHWLPERMQGKALPATLRGVLEARLAALPEAERHALQLAAVVGMVFWDAALRELDGGATDWLAALQARELIVPRLDSRLPGQHEYAFRHHTLYQTCYEGTLKRVRRPTHAKLARWLVGQADASHDDLVAEHFERGGEAEQALEYWQRAADSALARFANRSAADFAERALNLVGNRTGQEFAFRLLESRAMERLCEHQQQARVLCRLDELANVSQLNEYRAHAALQRAIWLHACGESEKAIGYAEQALQHAAGNLPGCAARACQLLIAAHTRLGQREMQESLAEMGLRYARAAGSLSTEATILNELGTDRIDAGDYAAAIHHYEAALALHRTTGHRLNEGGTLANLAYAGWCLGDYAAALAQYGDALALSEAVGQRQNASIIRINIALVLLSRGEPASALRYASEALEQAEASEDRWVKASALRVAGRARLAANQKPSVALSQLEASHNLFVELGFAHLAMEAVAELAEAARQAGDPIAARRHAGQVHAHLRDGGTLEGCDEPLRILFSCHLALRFTGDPCAAYLLEIAKAELLARADRISDLAARTQYLQAVEINRAIMAELDRSQPLNAG